MARSPVRRVAVVGGGIAGLTLAVALGRDVEVVVHEADPGRAGAGSSLVLWRSAGRALDRLGVLDAVRHDLRPVGRGRLFDLAGRPLTSAHDPGLAAVPRPALLAALAAALPRGVRRVEDEVTAPEDLDADLVVGADGVRSRVRGLVDPARSARRSTPYLALRGVLPRAPEPDRVGEYWGPGALFGLVAFGDGGSWFTTHRGAAGPEPLDVPAVLAQARTAFGDAHPALRRTLAEAGPGTSATRVWVAPPLRRYTRGRYVVLGDAAHAMTPNLGRGAGEAVLDAVSLAAALRAGAPLARWEARRLPVTQAARAASGVVMRTALLRRGAPVRDAVLRVSLAGAGPRAGRG
ncbi:FAD-dependent monooxygenase [Phycicoccus flavus]|uniref:FAD-dependent monooxygenase n=1 Tax=Phycicoccus flavus TaxID=2502783 RepID=UPI000FEC0C4A|nr:NAD(P)/FAD-dependent oxidoreductase [Phycicoccus flavus]NHA67778.1 FAD-dependent monooxygenase [Phycicoccus flavus]